jgi:hypothetical protein
VLRVPPLSGEPEGGGCHRRLQPSMQKLPPCDEGLGCWHAGDA